MRNVHSFAAVSTAYVLFLMIAGCAALGVPPADTFNKKAAAAVTTVNAASQSVLTLLQARKITPDESDAYTLRTEQAQQAIDAARSIYSTDPNGANDALAKVITALTILQTELEARK